MLLFDQKFLHWQRIVDCLPKYFSQFDKNFSALFPITVRSLRYPLNQDYTFDFAKNRATLPSDLSCSIPGFFIGVLWKIHVKVVGRGLFRVCLFVFEITSIGRLSLNVVVYIEWFWPILAGNELSNRNKTRRVSLL